MRNFLSSFALLKLKQLEKERISAATKREKKEEGATVLGEKTVGFTCCFCTVKKRSAAGSLLQKQRKPRELRRRSWREKRRVLPPFILIWTIVIAWS
jgi:hypothetical protein